MSHIWRIKRGNLLGQNHKMCTVNCEWEHERGTSKRYLNGSIRNKKRHKSFSDLLFRQIQKMLHDDITSLQEDALIAHLDQVFHLNRKTHLKSTHIVHKNTYSYTFPPFWQKTISSICSENGIKTVKMKIDASKWAYSHLNRNHRQKSHEKEFPFFSLFIYTNVCVAA